MTSTTRILVFDSGVGGLSILATLKKQLPGCNFTYASDNAAFPYGLKSENFLIERVDKVFNALFSLVRPEIAIIACNTASTITLPTIRSRFDIPIVGVVPAIKPAVSLSSSKVIGVLGTPGTVNREYTQKLIRDFATHCQITKVGSSRLVEIVEEALRGKNPNVDEIKEIIQPLFSNRELDTVVLACTHFPLIKQELKITAPWPVNWIDSGAAIARRVEILRQSLIDRPACKPEQAKNRAIFTADSENIHRLIPALRKYGCTDVSFIAVD